MAKIGLTGRIASGKSTVASYLAKRGYEVADGDKFVHEILDEPEIQVELLHAFGQDIFVGGKVSRKILGPMVFANSSLRDRLEKITKNRILEEFLEFTRDWNRQKQKKNPNRVLESYNIIQSGVGELLDEIWVVDTPEDTQLAQLVMRNKFSIDEARRRIAAQPPRQYYLDHAHVILRTDGDIEHLYKQVDDILDGR